MSGQTEDESLPPSPEVTPQEEDKSQTPVDNTDWKKQY